MRMDGHKLPQKILALGDDESIEHALIRDQDLSRSQAERVLFDEVLFRSVRLQESVLPKLTISGCGVNDSDFSTLVAEEGDFTQSTFERSKLTGIVVTQARVKDTKFDSCAIDLANWRGSTLKSVTFVDCNLQDTDFQGATLQSVTFEKCDLRSVQLSQTTMKNVNICGSQIDGIGIELSALQGLKVDMGQAIYLAKLMGLDIEM